MFEHLTNSTWHHLLFFKRCLQPAIPIIVFPDVTDCISLPYVDFVFDRFPDCALDRLTDYCPTGSPTGSRPVPWSRPVLSRREIVDSRPVPSFKRLSAFPSHSRPAISNGKPFPNPSLGITQNVFHLRRGKLIPPFTAQCLNSRAYD